MLAGPVSLANRVLVSARLTIPKQCVYNTAMMCDASTWLSLATKTRQEAKQSYCRHFLPNGSKDRRGYVTFPHACRGPFESVAAISARKLTNQTGTVTVKSGLVQHEEEKTLGKRPERHSPLCNIDAPEEPLTPPVASLKRRASEESPSEHVHSELVDTVVSAHIPRRSQVSLLHTSKNRVGGANSLTKSARPHSRTYPQCQTGQAHPPST